MVLWMLLSLTRPINCCWVLWCYQQRFGTVSTCSRFGASDALQDSTWGPPDSSQKEECLAFTKLSLRRHNGCRICKATWGDRQDVQSHESLGKTSGVTVTGSKATGSGWDAGTCFQAALSAKAGGGNFSNLLFCLFHRVPEGQRQRSGSWLERTPDRWQGTWSWNHNSPARSSTVPTPEGWVQSSHQYPFRTYLREVSWLIFSCSGNRSPQICGC